METHGDLPGLPGERALRSPVQCHCLVMITTGFPVTAPQDKAAGKLATDHALPIHEADQH